MPKGDREILKADLDDGYTKIANLLLEALAIAQLTGKEKGAVLYLWRQTYGWYKNGDRLKEAAISLQEWAWILNTDKRRASVILAGLERKGIFTRRFLGPGKGYYYATNTTVGEWCNSCIKQQQLHEKTIQQLPKSTTVVLHKTATPLDTNLATLKERKERKERIKNIDIDSVLIKKKRQGRPAEDPDKYIQGKYGHMVQR